jgi:hypothetical protein
MACTHGILLNTLFCVVKFSAKLLLSISKSWKKINFCFYFQLQGGKTMNSYNVNYQHVAPGSILPSRMHKDLSFTNPCSFNLCASLFISMHSTLQQFFSFLCCASLMCVLSTYLYCILFGVCLCLVSTYKQQNQAN